MNRIYNCRGEVRMMWVMRRLASSEAVRAKWQRIIRGHRGSGLSVAAFCRRERVPQSSFFAWKRRLASESGPAFVEVRDDAVADEAQPADDTPLELLLGRDRRLVIRRGFDAQALREVVRALEGLA
jgi:hypothetical protein